MVSFNVTCPQKPSLVANLTPTNGLHNELARSCYLFIQHLLHAQQLLFEPFCGLGSGENSAHPWEVIAGQDQGLYGICLLQSYCYSFQGQRRSFPIGTPMKPLLTIQAEHMEIQEAAKQAGGDTAG